MFVGLRYSHKNLEKFTELNSSPCPSLAKMTLVDHRYSKPPFLSHPGE
jgi:hypothetical protein